MSDSYQQARELAEEIFRHEEMLFAPDSEWRELVESLRLLNISKWVTNETGQLVTSKKYPGSYPRPSRIIPEENFPKLPSVFEKVPKRTVYRNRMLAYAVSEIVEMFGDINAAANPSASKEVKARTASGIVADVYNNLREELNPALAYVKYDTARIAFSDFKKLRPVAEK